MPTDSSTRGLTREEIQGVFSLYSNRRLLEALAETQRLQNSHPDAPLLLNIRGAIHAGLGQLDDAVASYHRALQISPGIADTHFHLGNALTARGDHSEALAEFAQAVQLRPEFVEAHGKLCRELERANRLDELREALASATRHCPADHPLLQLRRAELCKREGDFPAARRILEAAASSPADPETLEARAYLLAEICDQLGDASAAFQFSTEANRHCGNSFAAQQVSAAPYLAQIDSLTTRFTDDWVARWSPLPDSAAAEDPVFLVGFPRSGTTLLDTLLRSHHDIAVVEEKPTVSKLEQAVNALPGGYPEALAGLTGEQREGLRKVYFAELGTHLPAASGARLVVDKWALNLVHAGLLQRLFPGARFLFAQRHPCDCVLSCFMRSFELNEGMVNFLQLDAAARLYDRSMALWQQYGEVLPLQVHTVRYEQLVSSLQETLEPALAFLGLDWDEGMRNYTETAQRRGNIETPSYHQVTQDIYTHARGRWQRYREQLAPVLPVLQPWAQRLGYTD